MALAALVMTGAGGLMTKLSVALPVPAALVALNVTEEVPVTVGVPEILPFVVLMDNPEGKPVAL